MASMKQEPSTPNQQVEKQETNGDQPMADQQQPPQQQGGGPHGGPRRGGPGGRFGGGGPGGRRPNPNVSSLAICHFFPIFMFLNVRNSIFPL